jgi:hypothetical protein
MKKPKLFTNQDRTSYTLWWFTKYGTKDQEILSKIFKRRELAEKYEEVYNQVIQEYSHLQYEYEGDELQDKINEIVDERMSEIEDQFEKLMFNERFK